MVNISKNNEMAHAAGFTGQRAAYTWAGRINLLNDLRFIDVKAGKSGAISHILIWNPHRVIRWHHGQKTPGLVEANFNALLERALDIGANEMIDEVFDDTCCGGRAITAISRTGRGVMTPSVKHSKSDVVSRGALERGGCPGKKLQPACYRRREQNGLSEVRSPICLGAFC